MTVLGSPGVKGPYLGTKQDSSNGVHQVFVVFTKVPIHGISVMQRPAEAMMEPKAPTYGIRGAASSPKVTIYGEGCQRNGTGKPGGQRSLLGSVLNGLDECAPARWVPVLMPTPKFPHERGKSCVVMAFGTNQRGLPTLSAKTPLQPF